ncbi:hypothetical protein MIMGU_mgv1a010467mg [Erythranthe guttata]|uniref:Uncharacterized protein n=1 Tax=Erythranthe guttata TaxID=4155 RepID=A0A022RTP5_ERYGU|nr:PREDICTED: uncharacterized protein LOC105952446 [Erythranthe guttata]EYU42315.1 hypothetical protein MIMGU_mgv1a010467mg [Erythranthe guttata]|eukprot:XP_012831453.1 PREDICTED: uncharacterized protein LOC105952446 [Erythranthe guttata]
MKCKRHPADLSNRVGVCASCLRERLSAIIAAQVLKQAHHECLKSDAQKPRSLPFPRSVSPYISRRKSDTAAATWQIQGRFYSTPHVGPTGSITVEIKSSSTGSGGVGGRFSSLISGLFRSKSDKPDSNHGPVPDPRVTVDSCSANPSWFSTIIRGGRKKKIRNFSIDENPSGTQPRRTCRIRDRGMSPETYPPDDDEHCHGGSSGYSSESSPGWKQTPRRTPASTRRGGGRAAAAGHSSNNISAFAFCLSPLVRASPNRQWSQKGAPPEMAVAGESRAPAKPHLSTAASFCKNRSRKLADFGRYNYDPPTH